MVMSWHAAREENERTRPGVSSKCDRNNAFMFVSGNYFCVYLFPPSFFLLSSRSSTMAANTSLSAAAVCLLVLLSSETCVEAFQSPMHITHSDTASHPGKAAHLVALRASQQQNDSGGDLDYKNLPTKILSNFMSKSEEGADEAMAEATPNPIDAIDFDAPKFSTKVDLPTLAAILDYELTEKEWFVTGKVNPIYFSDDFEFQDPDVQLSGIEDYARGVYKLFDQDCSRAEIISCKVNPDLGQNIITVTWRLSGRVSIGPGLAIKPYICFSDFTVDEESGLVVRQEDRFDIPQWDILLSALFPFLIGKVTKEPAPPVEPRVVTMPSIGARPKEGATNPFEKVFQGLFG